VAWGLASTGGRCPDRVLADRGPAAARSISSRSGWCRVDDVRDSAGSGRGREEREAWGARGPT
jgi:hypothetical protein